MFTPIQILERAPALELTDVRSIYGSSDIFIVPIVISPIEYFLWRYAIYVRMCERSIESRISNNCVG